MNKIVFFLLFTIYVSACRTETAVPVSGNTVNQSVVSTSDFSLPGKTTAENPATKGASSGEITNCAPEKFARGAKLVINLKTPNGGYLAIERMGKKPDYFLLSDEEDSDLQKLAATTDSLPFWTTATLKTLKRIELDSTEARAVSLSNLDKQGKGKAELIFSRAGWYTIEISNESLEQDDAPVTGRCRVYFSGSSALQAKNAGDEILFDFRKDSLPAKPEINRAERERVFRAAALNEEADSMEISSKETGAFTAADQNQTAYLIRPDVSSIAQDPTNPAQSALAVFAGEKLVSKFDAGNYFYITAKTDVNRDGVNELLLTGNNLQMGIETRWAKLINLNGGKLQAVKDFKTVYTNTCEGAVGKKELGASLIKYKFASAQSTPVFSSQNIISPCR